MNSRLLPKKVLLFRPGQLGDTLAALPALHALHSAWPGTRITLLHDIHEGRGFPTAQAVLDGSGLVEDFVAYDPTQSGFGKMFTAIRLTAKLRPRGFDAFVYLAPALRTPQQRKRDMLLPRLCGIRRVVGDIDLDPRATDACCGDRHPHEADLLLQRLATAGIPVPDPHKGCMDLRLTPAELQAAEYWRTRQPISPSALQVAFGPGSKMPAKRWPPERYAEVGKNLIEARDIWPVVFGGPEDAETGLHMVRRWGRGSVAAGALNVRESAAALMQCRLFVGNDTGTMHLAASVGVPSVTLFSARDLRGTWYPYGRGRHVVFREAIDCEGCMLTACTDRANECLTRIDSARVTQSCLEMLSDRAGGLIAH